MSTCERNDTLETLATVRDWLRYAVSRFGAAGLSYGHGTSSALDEAAYLILSRLALPIDGLEPWLDARLTRTERQGVLELIEARIVTRKPAAYLLNRAWIRGHTFYVDERVIVPRSYIGELIEDDGLAAVIADPAAVTRILDLCTGSGCLAILAALRFPEATVDAVDISPDALEVARRNVADYGLDARVSLLQSDLFSALGGRSYDLILCNPPYVDAAAVAAFPPEHRAEPLLAHAGGADGLDIVNRVLADAGRHLSAYGAIVMEVGSGRLALEAAHPGLPFLWLDTAESEGEVLALQAADLVAKGPRKARPARRPPRGPR